MFLTSAPYQQYFDADGSPLDAGFVYFGQPNQNPETVPQAVYWDEAGTQPAAQPVLTLNGYTVRSGTPATLYAPGDYSVTVKNRRGSLIAYNPSSSSFLTQLASQTDAAQGAALVGYKPPFTGSVGRTVSDRLADYVSAKDFGLATTNTGAQNVAAINLAIAYSIAQGGCTIHIPRGTYDFNGTVDFGGANDTRVTGDGPDATILRITHATADFFKSTGTTFYQAFDNFTLTSSVTRSAGAMFKTGFWKRGRMERVKITQHFDGVNLPQFEQCTLMEVDIVNPTGAGTAIIAGTSAATNQGSNLNIVDCFLRGNDDTNPASAPVGNIGIVGYDVEAIFGVNTDIANFVSNSMYIAPQFAAQNWHFTQMFFDGTKTGDNIVFAGVGVKSKFSFTGCWIASAGKVAGGTADVHGVHVTNTGTYLDINFTGGRIRDNNGDGILFENKDIDFTITGVEFFNNGVTSATYKYGIQFAAGVAQTQYAMVSGCRFRGNGTADIRAEINSKWNGIVGCFLESGVSDGSSLGWGACQGNVDITSFSVASAAALRVSPTKEAVTVTGTTNITSIFATYPNHLLTLSFAGALTVNDGSNLQLNGNLVTAAGSVLTLRCQADGNWREIGRTTT